MRMLFVCFVVALLGCDDATAPLDGGRYELVTVNGEAVPTGSVTGGFVILIDGSYHFQLYGPEVDFSELGTFRVESDVVTFVPDRGLSPHLEQGSSWVAEIRGKEIHSRNDDLRGAEVYRRND